MERADVMIMRMISPTAMLTICRLIDWRIIVTSGERYTHRLPPHDRHDHIYKNQPVGDPGRRAQLFQRGKYCLGFVVIEGGPSYRRASRQTVARSTLKGAGDSALAPASGQPEQAAEKLRRDLIWKRYVARAPAARTAARGS